MSACIFVDRAVADDAAGPEGPRAELHAAVKPADDLSVGHACGDMVQQLRFVGRSAGNGPQSLSGSFSISLEE